MEDNNQENINIKALWQRLWSRRMLFVRNCAIAFVLACVWIFPQVRTYEASVVLAPETTGAAVSTSGLSGIAASFGINLGKSRVVDAIYPTIYPNVMQSRDFTLGLMDVEITTSNTDEPLTTTYYDYLANHQKHSFWEVPLMWLSEGIGFVYKLVKGEAFDDEDEDEEGEAKVSSIDPFRLTVRQEKILKHVRKLIGCSIEDKTCIITLRVRDQDPLVCATMADSVQARLQRFITNYKTGKARIDMEYYASLCEQSRKEYEEAQKAYSDYLDAHVNATLQSTLSMIDHLRNNQQLKQTSYSSFMAQYEAARAKVQEETPSFTTLQSATVPTKAVSPLRGRFVILMTLLTGLATACYLLRTELRQVLANTFRRKAVAEDDDDF